MKDTSYEVPASYLEALTADQQYIVDEAADRMDNRALETVERFRLAVTARPEESYLEALARMADWMAWVRDGRINEASGNCPESAAGVIILLAEIRELGWPSTHQAFQDLLEAPLLSDSHQPGVNVVRSWLYEARRFTRPSE